jgi:glycosyltransferase involved in cell wall biosynthesis
MVARQDRAKGGGVVIHSVPLLVKAFPQVQLDLIGDGPALAEYRNFAKNLGIIERIRFHGKLNHEQVIGRLQEADVFCYPTMASEGFPKVVLEALATGLPVVTTPVSVLPYLLKNGCGIVIEKADPELLAAAVLEVFATPGRYEQMSKLAIETASKYSLEGWAAAIRDICLRAWTGGV